MSPASWFTDLLDPNHREVMHLFYLSSRHIFSLHTATSSADLHAASSTPRKERNVGLKCVFAIRNACFSQQSLTSSILCVARKVGFPFQARCFSNSAHNLLDTKIKSGAHLNAAVACGAEIRHPIYFHMIEFNTMAPDLSVTSQTFGLPPLAFRQMIVSMLPFCCYYFGHRSSELSPSVPIPLTFVRRALLRHPVMLAKFPSRCAIYCHSSYLASKTRAAVKHHPAFCFSTFYKLCFFKNRVKKLVRTRVFLTIPLLQHAISMHK